MNHLNTLDLSRAEVAKRSVAAGAHSKSQQMQKNLTKSRI